MQFNCAACKSNLAVSHLLLSTLFEKSVKVWSRTKNEVIIYSPRKTERSDLTGCNLLDPSICN